MKSSATSPGICVLLMLILVPFAAATSASGQGPTESILFLCEGIENPAPIRSALVDKLATAVPGSRVHVVHNAKSVGSFWVPAMPPKVRHKSKHVKHGWAKIMKLLAKPIEGSEQVNLPGLPAKAVSVRDTNLPLRVGIYGAAAYLNPRKAGHNHAGYFVTADGAIDAELSPWRTDKQLPTETLVTWVTPTATWGIDSVHAQEIERFNRLFLQENNATLIRITDKPSLLFNHYSAEPIEHIAKVLDGNTTRRQVTGDTAVENGDPTSPYTVDQKLLQVSGRENTETKEDREALVAKAMNDRNSTMLILTWESKDPMCDLDLWVSSQGLQGELNHANPKLPWGRLTRDVQNTEHANGDPDVTKHEAVFVSHGRLDELTAWVNVYRTSASAKLKITRIWNRKQKSRTVEIKSPSGDGGRYQRSRVSSTAWKRINLLNFSAGDVPGAL
ncbi:hypothetical protein [Rhodopirellula baltica]